MFRHVVVSAVRRSYDSDESGYESPECHCSACAEFPLLFVELKLSSSRLNDRLTSPFPLRRYDNLTGNDRRNVKRLLNAYLQHTETMDVPIGLENQDFDWCESHLQSLKTVRYYNDPDIEPVDEEYVEGEYTLPLTANTLVIMHRGILDFNQWHYVPPIRSSVVQKVVINVPYTVPTGPIGHYMLHATSDFDCPQVVHIFHHYAKNDALPEPPGLVRPDHHARLTHRCKRHRDGRGTSSGLSNWSSSGPMSRWSSSTSQFLPWARLLKANPPKPNL